MVDCFNISEKDRTEIFQSYFEWIPFVLVIQAMLFYIPACVWKASEGGLLHKLCHNLGKSRFAAQV